MVYREVTDIKLDTPKFRQVEDIELDAPDSSAIMAGARGVQQGATLGYGDEAQAAIGAGIAKMFGGKATTDTSFGDLYNESLASQNKTLDADYRSQFGASLAGNIVGGALGAGGAAGLQALAKVAPNVAKSLVKSSTFLGARAKDALQGVVVGSVAGAGADEENRLSGAVTGGALGGVLSPIAGAVGAGIGKLGKTESAVEKYIAQQAGDLQPIRLSAADLGDKEARSVFQLAKVGKLGKEASDLANEFSDAQSRDFADNFISLYKDGKVTNEVLGEGLASRLSEAASKAKALKTEAYKLADPALKVAKIEKGNLIPLSQDLRKAIDGLDFELVPEARKISQYADTLDNLISQKNVKDIKLNTIEALRKRIGSMYDNSLSGKGGRGNLAVVKAKNALDNFSNDILEQGIIEGDAGALQLIKEARQANKYWKDNFSGDNANSMIRKFITNEGENLTPEMLLNKFLSVSEGGLDGIKSAKAIFGDNVKPIFKQGLLNKIYNSAITKRPQIDDLGRALIDESGLPIYDDIIQPERLANAIERVIGKDAKFVREAGFEAQDIKMLRQLQVVARRVSDPFDKTNPSGSGNRLIDYMSQRPMLAGLFKLPIAGDIAEAVSGKVQANRVRDVISGADAVKTLGGSLQGLNKPLKIDIFNNPQGKVPPQFRGM
jgi:hypothetical protein